jgi:excisionase family DNA binding protein
MLIPAVAIRGGITLLSEIIQIVSGVIMLVPERKKSEIRPEGVYSTSDAAKLLRTTRLQIIQFIRDGELVARRVGDRYHISGKSLIVFLTREKDQSL